MAAPLERTEQRIVGVLIEKELCGTCNVQRGPVWVFRPARTRPEVLRAIQRAIHVPAAVARTSVAAWRER